MIEKKEHIYEKAVLVGLITKDQDEDKLTEYLDELEFLAYTAGATVERRFFQKMLQPDSKTFVGKGKMEEIRDFVKENKIGTIIFDDELSPSYSGYFCPKSPNLLCQNAGRTCPI